MEFVNRNYDVFTTQRNTLYNGAAVITRRDINKFVEEFDSLFDSWINFTNEISSLMLYPIVVATGLGGTLVTAKGSLTQSTAYTINGDRCYYNLGQQFINRYFGNFADYRGYTQIKVYLPLLGYVDVDPNECMGKYLQFRLVVDFYSGKGMYIVGVSDQEIPLPSKESDAIHNMRILSVYETDIGVEIPLGSSNIGDIRRNAVLGSLKIAASATIGVAGISAPSPTTTTTSVKTYDIQGRGVSKGSKMKQIKSGTETTEKTISRDSGGSVLSPLSDCVQSSLNVLNNSSAGGSSDRVNDSGLMNATAQKVHIVFYRPKFVEDDEYASLYGIPLGKTVPLSTVYGYTEINKVHVEGAVFETATEAEKEEIHSLLLNGVIL